MKKTIDYLVSNGAKLDMVDVFGQTPLHYGVEFNLLGGGGFEFYLRLVTSSTVNMQNGAGQTALHIAADQHRQTDPKESKTWLSVVDVFLISIILKFQKINDDH